jgi:hypothetical protein
MVTFLAAYVHREKVQGREKQNFREPIKHKTRCALLRNHPEPHAGSGEKKGAKSR